MPPRKQRKHSKQQELQHNTDQDSAVLILAEAKAEPKELFVKESLFSILPLSETLSGKHGILHIVILAVILLVAVFLPMHSEMTHNQAAIKDLVARVEIIESAPKQQLTQEQLKSILSMAQLQEKELPVATQVSEPVAEPSDTPDKIVHHYTPPANPERRYTYDDFQSYWNITALHTVTFPPEIDAVLATREIKNDAYYNVNPAYFDDFEKKYCTYISAGSHEYEERVMMHVKWSGPAIGYGVFASMDIPADVPIGVYTGVVTLHTKNTDYAWSYFTKFDADAKELDLTTDAKYAGNYHRFVNHDIKNQNVRAIVTPCRNRWYVIYVSSKPIPKDTELLTSYGAAYFDTR